MDEINRPHPKNEPGPFYVVDGCCISCGVWEAVAPDLFAWEENHCYVKRQPSTQAEMERMIDALRVVDVSCIRYRGRDPTVFKRLGALGEPDLAGFPPAEGIPVVLRNHVTFETLDGNPAILEEVVADFRSFFMRKENAKFRVASQAASGRSTWFEFAWHQNNFHRVDVSQVDRHSARVLISRSRIAVDLSRRVSGTLNGWLSRPTRFSKPAMVQR